MTAFHKSAWVGALLVVVLIAACSRSGREQQEKDMKKTGIDVVKEKHAPELLSLHGVVGVYIGQTGAGDSCIYVMVVRRDTDLVRKIPTALEGYPVLIQETGEIRPMNEKGAG